MPMQISLWSRVTVDAGEGTFATKVYFDNVSGGGGTQRGWADGPEWNARHYRPVQGNKESFCAHQYLWAVFVDSAECTSREAAISYEPNEEAVRAILPALRFTNF